MLELRAWVDGSDGGVVMGSGVGSRAEHGRPRRRTGVARLVAGVFWLAPAALGAVGAAAQDQAPLLAEFDAHEFTAAEKRLLQIGLALDESYRGPIDGRWGGAAQLALEAHAARRGVVATDEPAPAVPMIHAVRLAVGAMDFVIDHDLGYRDGAAAGHRLLAPSGEFEIERGGGRAWSVLRDDGLEITLFVADAPATVALHGVVAMDVAEDPERSLLRRDDRMVSTGDRAGRLVYARSDALGSGGLWATAVIEEQASADPRLAPVVASSITTDPAADIRIAGGRLVELALAAAEPAAATRPAAAPDAAPEPAPDAFATAVGSGTAFFVNATDLVTAAHVIDGCAEVTFDDGAPLAVLARHPTLDLAVLSSARRSRSFLPIAAARRPRLGEGVFALGFPLYGTLGTGLSMTRGNVSATTGLGDDPTALTVTAPIHPGNSGGPLMSLDGEIVGVVVATIDKLRMAEAFGALPENIGFAVTGAELTAFLDAEAVLYPTGARRPLPPDGGVPDDMQAAVVPVLCWGP